jgi:16S rRNA (uracil1498-N3)-methyltransferase
MIRVHHILHNAVAGAVVLSSEEAHYVAQVRRAKVGQTVQLFDGEGRIAHTAITDIITDHGRSSVTVLVDQVEVLARITPQITAVIPLIKGDRFDICLEKLTEVGVDHVVLWQADRAVVRLDAAKLSTRMPRWRSTLTAAARQARSTHTPTLTGPFSLAQLTDYLQVQSSLTPTARYMLEPTASQSLMQSVHVTPAAVVVMTGPEGGIAVAERVTLESAGFVAVKMGTNVLRAETAPVIATAWIRLTSQA